MYDEVHMRVCDRRNSAARGAKAQKVATHRPYCMCVFSWSLPPPLLPSVRNVLLDEGYLNHIQTSVIFIVIKLSPDSLLLLLLMLLVSSDVCSFETHLRFVRAKQQKDVRNHLAHTL